MGSRLGADGVHLEAEPAEQATLADLGALRSEGLSWQAIAEALNRRGIVTKDREGVDVADRPQGSRHRKVASIAEARVERLLDRIAERHRGDPERLAGFLAEQVEAEKAMGLSDEVRKAIDASGLSLSLSLSLRALATIRRQ